MSINKVKKVFGTGTGTRKIILGGIVAFVIVCVIVLLYFMQNSSKQVQFTISKTGYEEISSFNADRAVVKKDGKSGVVDGNGKIIVPLEYKDAFGMFEGGYSLLGAIGSNGSGYTVLFDKDGKSMIDTRERYQEYSIKGISENKILLMSHKIGVNETLYLTYENKTIKELIRIQAYADYGSLFYQGVAFLFDDKLQESIILSSDGTYERFGKINEEDVRIISSQYQDQVTALGTTSRSFYIVNYKTKQFTKLSALRLKPFDRDGIRFYSMNGGCLVAEGSSKSNVYNIVDSNTDQPLGKQCYIIDLYKYGTDCMLASWDGESWGYVNNRFEQIKWYEDATDFDHGYAMVIDATGKACVINTKFEMVSEYIEADKVTCRYDGHFEITKGDLKYILTIKK